MQMKASTLTAIGFTGCVALLLASCAAPEKKSASPAPEPKPAATPVVVVPFTPSPEPPPTPPPAPAPVAPPAANPADLPASILAWDSADKAVTVKFGEPVAKFQFSLTNVSAEAVTVVAVPTSCGCTAAHVPPMPWVIGPGKDASFDVNMTLAGKNGTVIKTVTFATDKGTKHLLVRTTIEPMTTAAAMAPGSREVNQRMAQADRQAVFRGDCASCHADVAKGKQGKELYVAACGVCHEAEHRASMVPDLHIAKQERNEEYWRNWITNGKAGSLMPAFALPAGGILDEAQIASLVDYLAKNMPAKPVTGASVVAPH